MKKINTLLLFLICCLSIGWTEDGGWNDNGVINPISGDLNIGSYSINGDSTEGIAFDPDNDGTDEILMTAAGGITADTIGINLTTLHGLFDIENREIYVNNVADIQPAINALEAADGGTVILLASNDVYTLTSSLTITGVVPLKLKGSGLGNAEGTRIDIPSGDEGIIIGRSNATSNNVNIVLENLYIFDNGGPSASGIGIEIQNINNVTLRNMRIKNLETGVTIQSQGSGNNTYNVNVENSLFDSNTTALVIENIDNGTNNFTNYVTVSDTYFSGNGTHLKLDKGTTTGELSHHKISDCYFDDSNASNTLVSLIGADNITFDNVNFDGVDGNNQVIIDSNSDNIFFTSCIYDTDISSDSVTASFLPNESGNYIFDSSNMEVDGTVKIEGANNNCTITVDDDGTCDSGTAMVVDNSIAVCAVCASN